MPRLVFLLIAVVGFCLWALLYIPSVQFPLEQGWREISREAAKRLGLKRGEGVSLEEKRIREEVILKKMEEASAQQDWRALAPEYPRMPKIEGATEEERMRALKNHPEFKALEREIENYLREKEEKFIPEAPIPSMKEALKIEKIRDRGAERVAERLLLVKERPVTAKPLEENLKLGIKGQLVTRRIIERPPPPTAQVGVEAEIEMMIWVLPNGMVDRVVPTIKGDAELERIAIQYLKHWRFAPLPKDHPQVEQSGTIPIKFKLQ
ncbi:MAG: TonB family protein [Desulfobacterota bacterium]|nr:TonB family protein [Thermodesulfobacteriota bacterium]